MDSVLNILRKYLETLTVAQFKKFKHHLKDLGTIPWGNLEKSDSDDTVDLIVQAYTINHSDGVILTILKKMNLNQLAMDMENELEERGCGCDPMKQSVSSLQPGEQEQEVEEGSQRKRRKESDIFCDLHRREVKLFCQDDGELVCYECINSEIHKSHNFRPISKQVLALKEELKVNMEPLRKQVKLCEEAKVICEQTATYIKSQFKRTEMLLKEEFEKLHQFLRDEEEARTAALREEETWKSEMMKEKIEKMSREISSLSDTIRIIEEEMGADDVTFLLNYKCTVERAQCTLQDPERVSGALINVAKHLGNLKFRVWEKMQETVQYAPMTLDPNTAHPHLLLSEDLTSVRRGDERQQLPDNPERFDEWSCVLGSEGFNCGTHCWDVEVGDSTWWLLGMTTESLQRKGDFTSKSGCCYIWHEDGKYGARSSPQLPTVLTVQQKLQRIRVRLDWDRGKLTFSDPINNRHIHTIKHSFTQRVFPFLANVCKLSALRILPVSVRVDQSEST
ncbi:zinc-binding protein A33-like isoform X1 [Sardina pilchardus]|uniref:zinc-binding protein A33-like isoform X1 n=1 Tax=Sardina pilchardus TaxID=27697 RepID=UPI002E0D7D4B